jgi:hypothetical protein
MESTMSSLAAFVHRTGIATRFKRALLIFWLPLVLAAIVPAVVTTVAYWLDAPARPSPTPTPSPTPPLTNDAPLGASASPPSEVAPPPSVNVPTVSPPADPTYWASEGAQGSKVGLRGIIEKTYGKTLFVRTHDGTNVSVTLADDATVTDVLKAALSDIKENSFVGISAMPQPDGTQKAMEVHIFPEASRGTSEGHRLWNLVPQTTITNANVQSVVTGVNGPILIMKYQDGEKTITVPNDIPIFRFVMGSRDDLKPGAKIFVGAGAKNKDGSVAATAINVEKYVAPN